VKTSKSIAIFISSVFILTLIAAVFALSPAMAQPVAQQATPQAGAAISFSGAVSQVNAGLIVVNGLTVSVANTPLTFTPQVGQTVMVNGLLLPDGQIVAQTVVIIIIGSPELTPEVTPEVTPETTAEPTASPTPQMTPTVSPTPDDDDDTGDDVIIVIEGPVQQINVNIITIYNINVVVNETDPILPVIQIGDIIRVEGRLDDDDDDDGSVVLIGTNTTITIIAITIIIVDVDVFINPDGGPVWRDDGSCMNPPPPWAPAFGWRRRCEGGGNPGGGRGGDDDDDDDDDDD
jgi:hypothetical protein